MSQKLNEFCQSAITPDITKPEDYQRYIDRLKTGKLTREENPLSHCCAMTVAYEPDTRRILVVNHKKAKSWIFPGGHIESDELPSETALREATEEIGLSNSETSLVGPFGAQVLDINNPPQVCREHYDIFYAVATNPTAVSINMREFLSFDWLSIDSAMERIKMKYYRDALDKFVKFMKW